MDTWGELTLAVQALLRGGMAGRLLAGMVDTYGDTLRWAAADNAPPPRSLNEDEQRALVPQLTTAALDLVRLGLLTVDAEHDGATYALQGQELYNSLVEPASWRRKAGADHKLRLAVPLSVRSRWYDAAYPVTDTSAFPRWDELSVGARQILVCAGEATGMLSGPFGILEDLPPGLEEGQRLAWADRQVAPLLPFVKNGWIEVRHFSDPDDAAFTVIPTARLRNAFADPAMRHDDSDEFGVGMGCVFTLTGLAVWRGGWSAAWLRELSFS